MKVEDALIFEDSDKGIEVAINANINYIDIRKNSLKICSLILKNMVSYKRIIAVVVTHNRCKLLKRCINNILNQSVPPEEILVINNGSTDNTKDELKKLKINTIYQDNLGSAGGWVTGIKYAIEKKFDAIWLMDDDGYPDRYF